MFALPFDEYIRYRISIERASAMILMLFCPYFKRYDSVR
jgi:hypothetical protein